ncbi:MAG: twin-arginine translocation signal domain-containing protein [Candidatus Aenigmarchaeota archaeon]|nr:twin-arginine translocation signal domain-containing protein [Candidatus Aenigmarchaeota archaeon]
MPAATQVPAQKGTRRQFLKYGTTATAAVTATSVASGLLQPLSFLDIIATYFARLGEERRLKEYERVFLQHWYGFTKGALPPTDWALEDELRQISLSYMKNGFSEEECRSVAEALRKIGYLDSRNKAMQKMGDIIRIIPDIPKGGNIRLKVSFTSTREDFDGTSPHFSFHRDLERHVETINGIISDAAGRSRSYQNPAKNAKFEYSLGERKSISGKGPLGYETLNVMFQTSGPFMEVGF